MTQRLDKLKMDKIRGPNSNHDANGPDVQLKNIVARTKLGVYRYDQAFYNNLFQQ